MGSKDNKSTPPVDPSRASRPGRPSSLLDTRIIYCGDNLEQLAHLPDACIDLIYIDPPFNSNRNYEVFWGETKEKRAFEDRHESTKAYIDYMRPRCAELARVLKKTGSFYYHCDWHASHYVKVMLDVIFGENNFINEIIWKRSANRSSMSKIFRRAHDVIFLYGGSKDYSFNMQYKPLSDASVKLYKHQDERGLYQLVPLLVSGKRNGKTGEKWRGIDPNHCGKSGMHWVTLPENLDEYERKGLVAWPEKEGGQPRLKYYFEQNVGVPLSDLWDDIDLIHSSATESLGYPTQKPLALLDRIIETSTNPNDIVLDAFCGCGTALVAAQNLGRQWIGIDVSPTACRVMGKRLRDVCGMKESEPRWKAHQTDAFITRDLPWTIAKLRAMPHFEFENWAVIALGGIPNKVQVGDMGIDGRIYPVGTRPSELKTKGKAGLTDHFDQFSDNWFPIQVKQVDKVGRQDIDSFAHSMTRENRQRSFFVSFDYTKDAEQETVRFYNDTKRIIKLLTVQEILDEEHLRKM